MFAWIIRETVPWFGEPIHRHSYMFGRPTAASARAVATAVRNHAEGEISIVGRICDGRTDYFPARLAQAKSESSDVQSV